MSSSSAPSASSASEDAVLMERAVRFDQECVLIPEPLFKSRRPRLVMKSYSLPLWNRRTSGGSAVSEAEVESSEEGVFFKVTMPRIIRSPSFTRDRSDEAPLSPLQSCLVRHEPGSPKSPRLTRRCTSPPLPRPDLVTVPLRACCVNCYPVTEECQKEGAEWKERFTRGARRRRNSSCSSDEGSLTRYGESIHRGSLQGRLLSVDEVDKRRRSSESGEDAHGRKSPTRGRDPTVVANEQSTHTSRSSSSPSLGVITASLPRQSPIIEEDEDQLFPLPSPRRSPGNSPTASTSCLSPKDEVDPTVRSPSRASSSSESISGAPSKPSPSIKKCEKGFLAPDPSLWLPSPTSLNSESWSSPPSPASPVPASSTRADPKPTSSTHPRPVPIPASFTRKESSVSSTSGLETLKVARNTSPETRTKRRASLQLHIPGPASIFRAGADVLRGVTAISGTPMST